MNTHSYPEALIVVALVSGFLGYLYLKRGERQHRMEILHAERLVITHPRTLERMAFTAPIPADLEAIAYELAPPEIRETVFARVSIAAETDRDLDDENDENDE